MPPQALVFLSELGYFLVEVALPAGLFFGSPEALGLELKLAFLLLLDDLLGVEVGEPALFLPLLDDDGQLLILLLLEAELTVVLLLR